MIFYNYFGNVFLLSQFRDILSQSLPSPLHAPVPPSEQNGKTKTWGTDKSYYSKSKRTETGTGTEQRKIFSNRNLITYNGQTGRAFLS